MMKKRKFGSGGMPSMKESRESGNRVSRRVGAETKKLMPATRSTRPSVGDAIASDNRMSKKNDEDLKAVKKYAKGGKVKRYADGDLAMSGAAVDLEAAARGGENLRELDRMDFSIPKAEAPAKKESFSAAFAAARKRGDKTFTWNGGSYGTKMKGEDTKSTKTTPPMSVATGRQNQTSAPAKSVAGKPMRVGSESSSAAKTNLREGLRQGARASEGAIKTVASGVKNAPSRAAAALESANEQTKTQSRNMAAMRAKNPDLITQILRASDPNNKKGGAGYAKGGVTRADGCAVRGKTKGKMV